MGATSGIGMEVAKLLAAKGWQVGIAGRRIERLQALISQGGITCYQQIDVTSPDAPAQLLELIDKLGGMEQIDVTSPDAPAQLLELIDKLGGMDLYFHSSGIGWQNNTLDIEKELKTVETNGLGFTRMVDTAFNRFATHHHCNPKARIACITSIAGTKGLGAAPAYSATKRFLNHYCHQAIPEPLSGMPVAAGTDASSPYRHYRYPTRFRKDRPYRRQQLSAAAQIGRRGEAYRKCH